MKDHKFGEESWKELNGVVLPLQVCTTYALYLSSQDFAVYDGLRTQEEQNELVAKGSSVILQSRHLTGHAVDLVPYVGGKLRWDWLPLFEITKAMHKVSVFMGLGLRWGGVWDKPLNELNPNNLEQEVSEYIQRRKDAGKRVFVDGAHYEIIE